MTSASSRDNPSASPSRLILGAAFVFATALPLSAQNALVNTQFMPGVGLTGWTATEAVNRYPCGPSATCGTFSIVPVSCCSGTPANGVQTVGPIGANRVYLSQCVADLTPNTDYTFGAWAMRSPLPVENGLPSARVLWYASTDCTGAVIDMATATTTSSTWAQMAGRTSAPPDARSAQFELDAGTAGLSRTPPTFSFAGPYVVPTASSPSVPALSGVSVLLCSFGFAAAGLAALARKSP